MQADSASGGSRTFSLSGISLHSLSRLLRAASAGTGPHLYFEDEEEEEGNDDDGEYFENDEDDDWAYGSHVYRRPPKHEKVTESVKEGVELLYSGDFGRIGPKSRSRRKAANIARQVLSRKSAAIPVCYREELVSVGLKAVFILMVP
jgi:WD repeat-containing protein 23